jgi:UDP-N-acetylmuramate--alanine ligase
MPPTSFDLTNESPIPKNRPVHIIGGGGVGMSALARFLIKAGFQVSASDKNGGKYLEKLGEAGARVWTGSQPESIADNAVIFYSSAIGPNDPERLWAKEHRLETHSRHGLLQTITRQYYTIAISGTHGKTTTTGWIAFLLELAGFDPNALVGGTLVQWNSNVRLGQGKMNGKEILVIEADESDESFLFIDSREVVVTNIELDHVDRYADLNHVVDKFHKFISNCQQLGGVFFPSFEVQDLTKKYINSEKSGDKITKIIQQISIDEKAHGLNYKSETGHLFFKVGLPGRHNLWNAFAVLAFALYHELPQDAIHNALTSFRGVERRMQVLGEFRNPNGAVITVIDDYAHHPTEIKMVLETLMGKYENVIVVWEPHRISRMIHFNEEFQNVFEKALHYKNIFLMDVFDAAGERQMPEFAHFKSIWSQWTGKVRGVVANKGEYELLMKSIHSLTANTVVVFLGAGHSSDFAVDFYRVAKG